MGHTPPAGQQEKGPIMSKKTMLLALAVASVAMFALPAAASALEIHLDNVTSFSGTAGASSLAAEGEPTITCESGDVEGTVEAGGTTATFSLDFTGCHTTVFGFTAKCRTTGSALDNTIKSGGTKHFITTSDGPASLWTLTTTTITCAGISNTIVHGSVIATLIFPQCNSESKELTEKFVGSGSTQEHDIYTGVTYTLTETTGEGGTAKAAALTSTLTTKSATTGKLTCT
jgi:hypothetical protein